MEDDPWYPGHRSGFPTNKRHRPIRPVSSVLELDTWHDYQARLDEQKEGQAYATWDTPSAAFMTRLANGPMTGLATRCRRASPGRRTFGSRDHCNAERSGTTFPGAHAVLDSPCVMIRASRVL